MNKISLFSAIILILFSSGAAVAEEANPLPTAEERAILEEVNPQDRIFKMLPEVVVPQLDAEVLEAEYPPSEETEELAEETLPKGQSVKPVSPRLESKLPGELEETEEDTTGREAKSALTLPPP